MERSLHCSIHNLFRIHEEDVNGADWMSEIITNKLKLIYCNLTEVQAMFPQKFLINSSNILLDDYLDQVQQFLSINQTTLSFDEYYKRDEVGYDLENEDCDLLQDDGIEAAELRLRRISEFCGSGKLTLVSSASFQSLINGAISSSSLSVETSDSFITRGIYVIDDNNDKNLRDLQRTWYDDPIPDSEKPYSWGEFIWRPIPTSNSVVITDRYLFQNSGKADGAKQVSDLLNCLIPRSFQGDYYVTILFEYDTMYKKNHLRVLKESNELWNKASSTISDAKKKIKDKEKADAIIKQQKQIIKQIILQRKEVKSDILKGVKERLSIVCKKICKELHHKSVKIDFIAVRDFNQYNRPEDFYPDLNFLSSKWQHFDYFTHDRLVISNYFWISATGALAVTREDNKTHEELARRQHIALYTLFHGVENKDQKREYCPYNAMDRYLEDLYSYVKNAPVFSYDCFRYDNVNEVIDTINYPLLKRNYLLGH